MISRGVALELNLQYVPVRNDIAIDCNLNGYVHVPTLSVRETVNALDHFSHTIKLVMISGSSRR